MKPMTTQQQQHNAPRRPVVHSMTRRNPRLDYKAARRCYMITLHVEEHAPLFGSITILPGDASPGAVGVALTPLGKAVRAAWLELTMAFPQLITPEDDFVVMPEHFHGLLWVNERLDRHLSRILAHFKATCNNAYKHLLVQGLSRPVGLARLWDSTYKASSPSIQLAMRQWLLSQLPPGILPCDAVHGDASPCTASPCTASPCTASPCTTAPFRITTDGEHAKTGFLFAKNYTDTIAISPEQIETKRQYIRNNPLSRWLRTNNRDWLQPKRAGIDSALTVNALFGYLRRECRPQEATAEALAAIAACLLPCDASLFPAMHRREGGTLRCDSYGNRSLLEHRLLPVVCHRRDKNRFAEQKTRCLQAAAEGAVLVSARIAQGEQDIMDTAIAQGYPIVRIADNGFPDIYHPSTAQLALCVQGKLLLVSPWQYHYRRKDDPITVLYCKAMNCVAQAVCRMKDSWWKEPLPSGDASPETAAPSGDASPETNIQKKTTK